jgi:hypothetical protein
MVLFVLRTFPQEKEIQTIHLPVIFASIVEAHSRYFIRLPNLVYSRALTTTICYESMRSAPSHMQ